MRHTEFLFTKIEKRFGTKDVKAPKCPQNAARTGQCQESENLIGS